jgi:hypothetical protein
VFDAIKGAEEKRNMPAVLRESNAYANGIFERTKCITGAVNDIEAYV